MGPPIVEWYYNADHDAVVVATTNTAYIILYLGRLDATVAPLAPTLIVLLEFL